MNKILIIMMLSSGVLSLNAAQGGGVPFDFMGGQQPEGMFDPFVFGGDVDPAELMVIYQQQRQQVSQLIAGQDTAKDTPAKLYPHGHPQVGEEKYKIEGLPVRKKLNLYE
jgi:hypothetical protein